MFNERMTPDKFDDWACVYETSLESEARLVQAYFKDQGLTCEVLSKKDSAYNVNFGDLSAIFIYVPNDQVSEAEKALKEWKDGKIDYKGTGDPEDTESSDDAKRTDDS